MSREKVSFASENLYVVPWAGVLSLAANYRITLTDARWCTHFEAAFSRAKPHSRAVETVGETTSTSLEG